MVKIQRSYPAPQSLAEEEKKLSGSYSREDVVRRLREDFFDKCYICEMKGLQDPEIEHLLPHQNGLYSARKFDWENLFWACGHCNSVKRQRKYDVGILNCCVRDPEKAMMFELVDGDVQIQILDDGDEEALLTGQLIYEVFNRKSTEMRIYASDFRMKELKKEMNILYIKLEAYKKTPDSSRIRRTLKALLRRDSAFAGFKRCYVRKRLKEFPELEEYIRL